MKQNTTQKQVDELSKKGKEVLFRYGVKKGFISESVVIDDVYENGVSFEKYLPFLSIGQMIEFLYEKKTINNFHTLSSCYGEKSDGWHVSVRDIFRKDEHMTYDEDELCDALWKPCKEILEQ